ncbi:hypothetical protein NA57DRAFT_59846 [Rhizodiscina lignyota]|uniref:Uncharacterized protein n=1 Tax=Rhizodiscina lignyota TaxID=1504668 RepID=A0A9P4M2X9_9PEZI|nr:hypothetical protein NA57DRAFT_59846 [Rhizodiscina lignyota]
MSSSMIVAMSPTPSSANTVPVGMADLTAFEREKLEDSRRNVPRYLFRGWSSCSGGGCHKEWKRPQVPRSLNSKDAVRPHAFLKGTGHDTVHDIPNLGQMIEAHLTGVHSPLAEFSSWAASLRTAVGFGARSRCKHNEHATKSFYIAVLDTGMLPENVAVYHVQELWQAGLAGGPYDHEYLAHGVIEGAGYMCVQYEGLMGGPAKPYFGGGLKQIGDLATWEEIRGLKSLAVKAARKNAWRHGYKVRDDIAVLLLVAFLSLRGKCGPELEEGDEVHPDDLNNIKHALAEEPHVMVPMDWTAEPSIMTDYPEKALEAPPAYPIQTDESTAPLNSEEVQPGLTFEETMAREKNHWEEKRKCEAALHSIDRDDGWPEEPKPKRTATRALMGIQLYRKNMQL